MGNFNARSLNWCKYDIANNEGVQVDSVTSRSSQIACTITTVHVTCTPTALHMHENLCTILIDNTIENY